jgi:hypothetical protein
VAARFDYDYSDNEVAEIMSEAKGRPTASGCMIFNNHNLDYAPRGSRLRALGFDAHSSTDTELF